MSSVPEYEPKPGAPRWRVAQWDVMQAEFDLRREDLPAFHAAIEQREKRAWVIVRRLCGIGPVKLTLKDKPDDCRSWERAELREKLGLSEPSLAAELDRIRGLWASVRPKPEPVLEAVAEKAVVPAETDDQLLAKFDFTGMTVAAESAWFAGKVRAFRKLLEHPLVGELARHSLLDALEIRRFERQAALLSAELADKPDMMGRAAKIKEREDLSRELTKMRAAYSNGVKELDRQFPFMSAVEDSVQIRGLVSELVEGVREFQSAGLNRIIDGIFTAAEIQILMQKSQQHPEAQYRPGQVFYFSQAKASIFDPKWKNDLPPGVYRRLDEGFRAAEHKAFTELGEPLVDLESDDPIKGEHDPLVLPGETLGGEEQKP